MSDRAKLGVLLMAYGTPGSLEEVEPYYTDIRRGRPPSTEQLQDLLRRYERVGGVSPLRDITFAVAERVEQRLRSGGLDAKVFVGMRHWHPFIAETVTDMVRAGIEEAVGLVLAPHYSGMSIGRYVAGAEAQRERLGAPMKIRYVERWGMNEIYLEELARRVRAALDANDPERTLVLFTAHSLPARLKAEGDPYEAELLQTASAVAERSGVSNWKFAFQSASTTGEPWLGPDILDVIDEAKASGGYDEIVACSVGFVADHLEILYDLDVEAAERCAELGFGFCRTPSLNACTALVEAVASEVVRAFSYGG